VGGLPDPDVVVDLRLALFAAGTVLLAVAGFCSPVWWAGFVPIGAALIWLSYNLEVEPDGATDTTQPPPH